MKRTASIFAGLVLVLGLSCLAGFAGEAHASNGGQTPSSINAILHIPIQGGGICSLRIVQFLLDGCLPTGNPTFPTGGTTGPKCDTDCSGTTGTPPLVVNQVDRELYVAAWPVPRVGEQPGECLDLVAGQISSRGTYVYKDAQGNVLEVPITNAYVNTVTGAVGCDPIPGFTMTNYRIGDYIAWAPTESVGDAVTTAGK